MIVGGSGGNGTRLALGLAVLLAAAFVAGLAGADGAIVRASAGHHSAGPFLSALVTWTDVVSGKKVSNFLLGPLLAIVGLAFYLAFKQRAAGRAAIALGVGQLVCVAVADFTKPLFGRPRPFQALADGGWHDAWFMGAQYGSFPSGHAAFYGALFLPLALLRPRWSPLLLLPPVLVTLERVLSTDHYLSDVAGSLLLALGVAFIVARWIGNSAGGPPAPAA